MSVNLLSLSLDGLLLLLQPPAHLLLQPLASLLVLRHRRLHPAQLIQQLGGNANRKGMCVSERHVGYAIKVEQLQ